MSFNETQTLQKPKISYEGSRQDHGDRESGRRQSPNSEMRNAKLRDQADKEFIEVELGQFHISDADYARLTDAQRDSITDGVLEGTPVASELVYRSEAKGSELHKLEDDSDIDPADRYFPSLAELGVRSKHEIGQEMARRVTLDVAYDEDDNGDSDYNVPVRVRNRM